jgi:hypothetical protein
VKTRTIVLTLVSHVDQPTATHAQLLDALAKQNFSGASPEVRTELLEFFGHPDAPYATKQKPKDWTKVQAELEQLKKAAPAVVTGEKD